MPTIKIDYHVMRSADYIMALGEKGADEIARARLAHAVADELVKNGFVTEEMQGANKVYSIRAIVMTMDEHRQHMTFKHELLERLAALESVAKQVSDMVPSFASRYELECLRTSAIFALKKGE